MFTGHSGSLVVVLAVLGWSLTAALSSVTGIPRRCWPRILLAVAIAGAV